MKTADLVKHLQVSEKTIRNWTEDRGLPHYRTPGGHLRYNRVDVVTWLEEHRMPVPDALRHE